MCWSAAASVTMVAAGGAVTVVAMTRGEPRAIWITLAYFTLMEGLQSVGYAVVDSCGTPSNRAVTVLSYLHIVFQPLFINAFAMAIAPTALSARMRQVVYGLAALNSAIMLLQLAPVNAFGTCQPGEIMCAPAFCLVSGEWHIGWQVPLNGMFNPLSNALGTSIQFPSYILAVFVMPLFYGVWRFVLFHLAVGPVLASFLTSDPFEMPAIWCLFSIGILLITLSPFIRHQVMGAHFPARPAAA
ncbi:DUF5765 domain-containing protein [Arenibacterium sp. CAU 1754]